MVQHDGDDADCNKILFFLLNVSVFTLKNQQLKVSWPVCSNTYEKKLCRYI